MSKPLLALRNVGLAYRPLRTDRSIFRPKTLFRSRLEVTALSSISFELNRGERIGVIGANGAGKTTLLRVAAGFLPPTIGEVTLSDSVTSLIDSGFGLTTTLSGRENAKTFAVMRGLQGKQFRNYVDFVASDCGLGSAFDHPVSSYSTGMVTRLVFSLCTATPPDVLILDELLSAGDAAFQEQARGRMREYLDLSNGILLASHNMGLINELCTRCIWLDKGTARAIGSSRNITNRYLNEVNS
jgi:ABC-type polysaccharide/polyol phosphate transport system ATPase subunit